MQSKVISQISKSEIKKEEHPKSIQLLVDNLQDRAYDQEVQALLLQLVPQLVDLLYKHYFSRKVLVNVLQVMANQKIRE